MAAFSNPFRGVCSSMETMPLDGKVAHHGGDVCVMCICYQTVFRAGVFVPAGMHSGVKLLFWREGRYTDTARGGIL